MPAIEVTESPGLPLTEHALRTYLESCLGSPIRIVAITGLSDVGASVKRYGYGTPLRVDYERFGRRYSLVIETIAPGPFGHEQMADRAQILLWSHRAYNRLPQHVRSLDVGGFRRSGEIVSVADIDEFFVLNEYVAGTPYVRDLERLRDGGELRDVDITRADALCDYLATIHRARGSNLGLYTRRLRELVGGNECIAGIIDSYPPEVDGITADVLRTIEQQCVSWRWRLKPFARRLAQVHGDFHPWNVLFQEGAAFNVIDRSRGEWGDPADDVTSLAVNYLFFSLLRSGRLEGPFETLFARFWHRYVEVTGDDELATVAGVFFAFRGLVIANPVWYPTLAPDVRRKLVAFVRAALDAPTFDPRRVNEYCEG